MNLASRTRIVEAHRAHSTHPPASEIELIGFETLFGAIPPDVRWYLASCGGGHVGDERIDDIASLAASHRKFMGEPWQMKARDAFVIGWDATEGPIAVDRRTGEVLIEDGYFGGIAVLAPSFEAFLLEGLVNGYRRWNGLAHVRSGTK